MAERGRLFTGREIAGDLELRPDVCVVGSGPGGSVMAARLAEAGADVVVLEAGSHVPPEEAVPEESVAYPRLYQERGQRSTADLSITILQGRTVGGSAAVNWTTSFRTPDHVLQHWAQVHGITGLGPKDLAPHFEAVEKRLHVHQWPEEGVNGNNRVLYDGAKKLGWQVERTYRNVDGCANLGYCGMKCPLGAKLSPDQSYLPDAMSAGARLYADTRASRLEIHDRRVTVVHAEVLDPDTGAPTGRRVTVRPRWVVLSGGAINTPALLLRSGVDLAGKVGARTFLHPVAGMVGLHPNLVEAYYGAPQSVASHQFADRGPGKVGFFMETAPLHPMLAATALGGFGARHQELMSRLPHAAALIALSIDGFLPDDPGGTVSMRRDGRVKIDYPIRAATWEALREGCKALARVHLAAGAELVSSLHDPDPVEIRTEADVDRLDGARWEAGRLNLFTAHQMGGCTMGGDEAKSVTGPDFRLRAHRNVFVVDGSVLPTSLGVNPQITIFGLAHKAAEGAISLVKRA